ncbi:MAG: primosomal protein N' [Lentisphaeria bacterium]|nr:primosomal protein N' [Candidatus Neomarinimicrobiota bacterium]MCF7841957.1 primosomal protein N' [Lentisphaeria bacterium]
MTEPVYPPYADLVFPLNVRQAFSFQIPTDIQPVIQIGQRVIAPLGHRKQQGMVIGFRHEVAPEMVDKMRPLERIVDPVPIFNQPLLDLLKWMSTYYLTPLGKVIQTAIPSDARLKKETLITWQESAARNDDDADSVTAYLREKSPVKLSALKTKFGAAEAIQVVTRLQRTGQIDLENVFAMRQQRPADFLLIPEIATAQEQLPRKGSKQLAVYEALLPYPGGKQQSAVQAELGATGAVLQGLVDKGLLIKRPVRPDLDPLKDYHRPPDKTIVLNPEQARATEEIQRAMGRHEFTPFFLFGVAGSGKTEVYLESAGLALEKGQSVIVLVPEIALAPQLAQRFQQRFGDVVALWHSNLRGAERLQTWQAIQRGEFKIVVGARSAVLTPVKDLGLIVVDEEQENAYKQEDTDPKYHARDVALMRGRFEKAVVILGSATPSLETYYNQIQSRFKSLHLSKRWEKAVPPVVDVVDMATEYEETEDWSSPFSRKLRAGIEETLASGKQVILLQNRRGYAPIVKCRSCGYALACPDDEITLTYHKVGHRMRCHFCGYESAPPTACPACGAVDLHMGGLGTQKVEEALLALFPDVSVCRMDLDTTRLKGAHQKILGDFARQKYSILLGTQMIAKGLDFENVTLVGVMNADSGLHYPDFRAREKTFQLVYQVAGRSGRGEFPGRVVIQTWQPDNFAIQCATRQDVKLFYNKELEDRNQLDYPPFSRLVTFDFTGPRRSDVERVAGRVAEILDDFDGLTILGPAPALVERSRDGFRWKLIVKSPKAKDPSGKQLHTATRYVQQRYTHKSIRMSIDVDPVRTMG